MCRTIAAILGVQFTYNRRKLGRIQRTFSKVELRNLFFTLLTIAFATKNIDTRDLSTFQLFIQHMQFCSRSLNSIFMTETFDPVNNFRCFFLVSKVNKCHFLQFWTEEWIWPEFWQGKQVKSLLNFDSFNQWNGIIYLQE